MKTQCEFRSTSFPSYPGEEEEINPGRFGRRLAEFLQAALPAEGFEVVSIGSEDWGWMVEVRNEAFPLWIGCGNVDGSESEFLCFIEPSQPEVRRWFRKIATRPVVEKLGMALESVLTGSGRVSDFHWVG